MRLTGCELLRDRREGGSELLDGPTSTHTRRCWRPSTEARFRTELDSDIALLSDGQRLWANASR